MFLSIFENYVDIHSLRENPGFLLLTDLLCILRKSQSTAAFHTSLRKDLGWNLVIVGEVCGMKGFEIRLVH
jgi:hypothetical protein